MDEQRKLTDEDIHALVDELEARLERKFYLNLGRGIWSIVWRSFVAVALFLVAVGSYKGERFF